MSFKEHKGDELDIDSAFIAQMFKANYKGTGPLYIHKTCALDTENCRRIFEAVRAVAITTALGERGLT